jgi:hypothetical protein
MAGKTKPRTGKKPTGANRAATKASLAPYLGEIQRGIWQCAVLGKYPELYRRIWEAHGLNLKDDLDLNDYSTQVKPKDDKDTPVDAKDDKEAQRAKLAQVARLRELDAKVLMTTFLEDPDDSLRRDAVQLMLAYGFEQEAQRKASEDPASEIRVIALYFRAHFDSSEPFAKTTIAKTLKPLICDEDPRVSKTAIRALSPLGKKIASAALRELRIVAENAKATLETRQEAIRTLGWLGPHALAAISALGDVLVAERSLAQETCEALRAIDRNGDEIFRHLAAVKTRSERSQILDALREFDGVAPSVLEQLEKKWRAGEEVARDPKNEARDKFVHEQVTKTTRTYEAIAADLASRGWRRVTKQRIPEIAKKYAKANGLPPPKPRQNP